MPDRKISLNEFIGAPPENSKPPRRVSLRFIGKIEVLKPLPIEVLAPRTPVEVLADRIPFFGHGFIFSARSLVFGGGLAMVAIILLSAILVAIYDPRAEYVARQIAAAGGSSDVTIDSFGGRSVAKDLFTLDVSTPQMPLRELLTARLGLKSRPRQSVQITANRPRRQAPRSRLVVSDFVPTNLIIYPENGVIKTRIEPQTVAVHRVPIAVPN